MSLRFQSLNILLCAFMVGRPDYGDSAMSNYTTICSLKDPELNECIKQSLTKFMPHLFVGIPEWDVPPMYPLHLPKIHFQEPRFRMNVNFIDSTLYGFNNLNIKKVRYNRDDHTFDVEYFFPSETLYSKYDILGRITMLPVRGKGNSTVIMKDVGVISRIKTDMEIRDGVKYLKLQEVKSKFNPKAVLIHLDNLFNGNRILENAVNNLFNSNWREMFDYVGPQLERMQGDILFNVATKILSQVPYNEMFDDADS